MTGAAAPLRPVLEPLRRAGHTLRTYDRATFRGDLAAGVTVAVVAIPQSMAYAIIAGVPAVYGLYTLIFQVAIGSILNSHPLLSVGPINTQSLLVASIATGVAGLTTPLDEGQAATLYLGIVVALTFLKGLLQLGMAAARLGNLVQYVSQSVIIGFTAGAGVLIAAGQIDAFLGFDAPRAANQWSGLIGIAQGLSAALGQTTLPAVLLGLMSLLIVLGSRAVSPLVPGPILAIVACGLIVRFAGYTEAHMDLVDPLPAGLPAPQWPLAGLGWTQVELLLPGALALALLGLLEAYSIGKSLAIRTGDRISANQELFSQGLTNFATSFLSCIPGSGSFSRSALNHYAGGQTFLAGIFNAACVLLLFLLFAPAARFIPMSSIAAILFVIAYSLIDWRYLLRVARSHPGDAAVCLGTFAATLVAPLAYAVFIGVLLNIALYLRSASRLHMAEMVRSPGGPFVERPIRERGTGDQRVMFVQLEGDLFFGVADELEDQLNALAHSGLRVVILRLKRTHSIDATVEGVLDRFVEQMHRRGAHVLLCGLKPELLESLRAYGLVDRIGRDNLFEATYGVFTSAKAALRRARELVGASLDADNVREMDETEGWAYEI